MSNTSPKRRRAFQFNLRQLILALSVASVIFTLLNALYASYRVQRDALLENTLHANQAYAAKLAEVADVFLDSARQTIASRARQLPGQWSDGAALEREVGWLLQESRSFDRIVIVDEKGRLRATAPESSAVQVNGVLHSEGVVQALKERTPLISPPYMSSFGRLTILISEPVLAADGRYLGYLGGVIHLQDDNVLNSLLGLHFYNDASYAYVVDPSRRLIYHPDSLRLGQTVGGNPIVEAVLRGETGSMQSVNSRGIEVLAGLAQMRNGGWGVVTQRPVTDTLATLNQQMLRTQLYTVPLFLLALFVNWRLSRLIALPLWQLATHAAHMDESRTQENIRHVRSWYFEAAQIKRSILIGLGLINVRMRRLDEASSTDPLTGLLNRRGMDAKLDAWESEGLAYAAILLDIDHFKQVNDTWGHDCGDKVLQHMAQVIRRNFRTQDALCRTGGEEFTILMSDAPLSAALVAAERLRRDVEISDWPAVGHITASLGVACHPDEGDRAATLRRADEALYRAKREGRNRTIGGAVTPMPDSSE